ncbi:MAG TPA: 4Fe-4S dicluster domain-containing protein [Tenuifilaceae bacterium]|nr:4Fe-4S dicluster domain-containing protein [Tenuifilaceae bacterium]HPE18410.1 4Fe-4S dicluster domain-containing protein [Tenuifilaceae bacterium]HPJ46237.1 4Fe-4S dicluster domain-containing protein [Tenuifilaceae bacterium]HPQ33859.1 4Fe-4S dicluster domain-containing protein [Tenuifilaceae bacterium]
MAKINPDFAKKLFKYGNNDFHACYNCGNCTAVCSLSDERNSFPRKMVRLSVLGLEDKIESSLDPWLCYYCGDCATTCPREANPGELMMSLRRWLTAKYDWTGLSGLLYRSLPFTLFAFIVTALAVIYFAFTNNFDVETIMHYGHQFEMWAIISVFALILLPNLARMWWFVILKPKVKVKFVSYFKGMQELFTHMFTQKQTLGCDDSRPRWFIHLIIVFGYLSLLFTTVVLDWFGTTSRFIIVLGYVESIALFSLTFIFVRGRIIKNMEANKFSQPSDWFFVIWLFLMAFSAFLVRIFIDLHLIETNLWLYLFHLIVLVQWAVIIVPFGKWTHFLYRSFAMYFEKLKQSA